MTNARRAGKHAGFTLVEVIVALAITAGALVLLACAGNESFRRSQRARQTAALEQLAESKLDEVLVGLERERRGEFAGHPGWSWEIEHSSASVEGLRNLERVTFRVFSPDSPQPWRLYLAYKYFPEERKP
jgi:general secretion pathway protein I